MAKPLVYNELWSLIEPLLPSERLLFCAAEVAHGCKGISDDFSVRVLFYGPEKLGGAQ